MKVTSTDAIALQSPGKSGGVQSSGPEMQFSGMLLQAAASTESAPTGGRRSGAEKDTDRAPSGKKAQDGGNAIQTVDLSLLPIPIAVPPALPKWGMPAETSGNAQSASQSSVPGVTTLDVPSQATPGTSLIGIAERQTAGGAPSLATGGSSRGGTLLAAQRRQELPLQSGQTARPVHRADRAEDPTGGLPTATVQDSVPPPGAVQLATSTGVPIPRTTPAPDVSGPHLQSLADQSAVSAGQQGRGMSSTTGTVPVQAVSAERASAITSTSFPPPADPAGAGAPVTSTQESAAAPGSAEEKTVSATQKEKVSVAAESLAPAMLLPLPLFSEAATANDAPVSAAGQVQPPLGAGPSGESHSDSARKLQRSATSLVQSVLSAGVAPDSPAIPLRSEVPAGQNMAALMDGKQGQLQTKGSAAHAAPDAQDPSPPSPPTQPSGLPAGVAPPPDAPTGLPGPMPTGDWSAPASVDSPLQLRTAGPAAKGRSPASQEASLGGTPVSASLQTGVDAGVSKSPGGVSAAGGASSTPAQTTPGHLADPATAQMAQARLVQALGGPQMQVTLHTEEFGRVSVHTGLGRESLATQITVDNPQLSAAISSHVPAAEQRMAAESGLRSTIQINLDASGTESGQGGSRSGGQPYQQSSASRSLRPVSGYGLEAEAISSPTFTPAQASSAAVGRLNIRI